MKLKLTWIALGIVLFLLLICVIHEDKKEAEYGYSGYYTCSEEWMWPVPDCRTISSLFGKRESPTAGASTYHKGIDIAASMNQNVAATRAGVVIVAENSSAEGNWIAIKHDDIYTSYYMHNNALLVKNGDNVRKGQVIALSGNTGISTGPHLHFAILKNGEYVDPLDYVNPNQEIKYMNPGSTAQRNAIVEYAKQFIGNPYVWGGTDLVNGADCSGFVMKIYEHFGITIPRVAAAQYTASEKISADEILPGDLLFYADKGGSISHVSMYIGNSQVIHASNSAPYPQGGIKISDIGYRTPCGYGRYITSNYSEEDLKYMAACMMSEAGGEAYIGKLAVGYVVMNRVNHPWYPNTVKGVVMQNGQFASPWARYLDGSYTKECEEAAIDVLNGTAENPIGDRLGFKQYNGQTNLPNSIVIGGNIFHDY